jgi:hypothetical protein
MQTNNMETALMKLFKKHNIFDSSIIGGRYFSDLKEDLLNLEREQIESAYEDGRFDGKNIYHQTLAENKFDYYEKTYRHSPQKLHP